MQRFQMIVIVTHHRPENGQAIGKAIAAQGCFEDDVLDIGAAEIWARGEIYLDLAHDEAGFAAVVARTIWAANGGYCPVEVISTSLPPAKVFPLGEQQYAELTK
jgi:hypothetical protein